VIKPFKFSILTSITAILDHIILGHFFHKFPEAGPGKLSRARARCVCAQTLTAIATKKLDIHKLIFCDSVSLVQEMTNTAQKVYATMSFEEIIDSIWRIEVPKALSDVVEALLGAVLIDSGWNYDAVREVVMRVFDNVLEYVHPNMPAAPAAEFMLWVARYGCTQVKYK
jgi:endoribonuclease Dicer